MTGLIEWLLGLLANIGLDLWSHKPAAPIVTESEKLGAATEAVKVADEAVVTETAIATAGAGAPKTKAAVIDALDKGKF